MTESASELKIRRRRIRHAVLLDPGPMEQELVRRCHAAGIRDVVTFDGSRSLGELMRQIPSDADVLICDGSPVSAACLQDLAAERRPNVVLVVPRLSHQLTGDMLKFELEPVDVPWYSRRIQSVGTDLGRGHGEVVGAVALTGAARETVTRLETPTLGGVCRELLAAGLELHAHAVAADVADRKIDLAIRAAI